MSNEIINYYDYLIQSGNDPVLDPPELRTYMDKWDGALFFSLLNLNPTQTVLEIGCGTGRLSVKTAPFVKSFCGIDISPNSIKTAKKHLSNTSARLICADFVSFNFSESFGLVYSSLTFMHIKNKLDAIKKVYNLLFPGGLFVLSIDKNQEDSITYEQFRIKIFPDDPLQIINFLKLSGFVKIRLFETEFAYIFSAERSANNT